MAFVCVISCNWSIYFLFKVFAVSAKVHHYMKHTHSSDMWNFLYSHKPALYHLELVGTKMVKPCPGSLKSSASFHY